MKITEYGIKDRQLQKEGHAQKASAEQKEYEQASGHKRITENNTVIAKHRGSRLLEKILERDNMNLAYLRVKRNKGAGGMDGMQVDELLPYLKDHKDELLQQLKRGKYKPNPVRRVEIPKEERGKFRKLGIPTVVDRVIQQAIAQVLTPIYETQFSEHSYGFRPGRGAHDALKACQKIADRGNVYTVDMDLEKFFDTVSQSKLIEVLSRSVKDGRVISLIHKYLNAGVLEHGIYAKTPQGVPQGGPLSPLLSNIMLNELDKEITRRGHEFIRYADDCVILCKSRKSAERTLENLLPFIERKLFLKVNQEKTKLAHISQIKYLGYALYRSKGKYKLRIHPKSIAKMKGKVRVLTARSNGWSNEGRKDKINQFVRGWVQYFRLADMKGMLREIDKWVRNRIRLIYWKQWKRIRTRFEKLKQFGIEAREAWKFANTRKGLWRTVHSPILSKSLGNKEIASLGYMTMTDYYLKVCEN
ncbi:group II intron reverse transcriptase/maturase [Pectinatus frisingensis]|uniref:group II intron reverse transcriptase/maturase n=1 Tax=Pectinatus frisingensis TaxID=865 RepID=UPI0018C839EC|nr:group II intron reverse transcriptase/maturase [Pectinatus frisingensis]